MSAWVQIAGSTLVHFVWQGAAIALVAAGGLRMLRRAAPNARYAVTSVALAAMLVSPVFTAYRLSVDFGPADAGAPPSRVRSAPSHSTAASDSPSAGIARATARSTPLIENPAMRAVVAVWLSGVVLLLIRLAGGWWKVRGLHRSALSTMSTMSSAVASEWQAVTSSLAELLHLRRVVYVVESLAVDTPTVVGLWRPVILLPIAALAGLTTQQVSAILAHELAHIRRHDYLVNLLQHVVETLLFYHPAVWWLSARMRRERELCCDEIAVAVCSDPSGYAAALAQLETWRHEREALAVAATHGVLIERVRHLLRAEPRHQRPLAHAVATATVVGVLIAMVGGGYRWPLAALGAAGQLAQRSETAPSQANGVAVTLNGEGITDTDIEQFRPLHGEPPQTPLPRVLVQLVNERLATQRGKQLGYALSDLQFRIALQHIKDGNKFESDDQLLAALAKNRLALADLRPHLERLMIVGRARQTQVFEREVITDEEAREYFNAHLDDFPLQTFDLAREDVIKQAATANLGRDWARYLQSLRSAAVIVWARPDLRQAYQDGLTQLVSRQAQADVKFGSIEDLLDR